MEDHIKAGEYFTLDFDSKGVTITHDQRKFRINDTSVSNGVRFIQRYGSIYRAMRDEKNKDAIPAALLEYERSER